MTVRKYFSIIKNELIILLLIIVSLAIIAWPTVLACLLNNAFWFLGYLELIFVIPFWSELLEEKENTK